MQCLALEVDLKWILGSFSWIRLHLGNVCEKQLPVWTAHLCVCVCTRVCVYEEVQRYIKCESDVYSREKAHRNYLLKHNKPQLMS